MVKSGNKVSHLTEEEKQLAELIDSAGCNWPDRLWLLKKTEVILETVNELRAEIAVLKAQQKMLSKEV